MPGAVGLVLVTQPAAAAKEVFPLAENPGHFALMMKLKVHDARAEVFA